MLGRNPTQDFKDMKTRNKMNRENARANEKNTIEAKREENAEYKAGKNIIERRRKILLRLTVKKRRLVDGIYNRRSILLFSYN